MKTQAIATVEKGRLTPDKPLDLPDRSRVQLTVEPIADFPKDDPRHGRTWHDCRQDALTLLGSEEAPEQYIAQTADSNSSFVSANEDPTTTYHSPTPTHQNRPLRRPHPH